MASVGRVWLNAIILCLMVFRGVRRQRRVTRSLQIVSLRHLTVLGVGLSMHSKSDGFRSHDTL
jgi:hypothetical protein